MAKMVFIQKSEFELNGVMHLASMLQHHGHTCEVLIADREPYLVRRVLQAQPKLVGFSLISSERHWALQLSQRLKQSCQVPIIWGGVDPTFYPESIYFPGVDIICRGEGELALVELLYKLSQGADIQHIPNLWVKHGRQITKNAVRPLVSDLDRLPPPDRSIYYRRYSFLRYYPLKRFYIGRGCQGSCDYCTNQAWRRLYHGQGSYVRLKSIECVLAEIAQVRAMARVRAIGFDDDNFLRDPQWLSKFLQRYRQEVGLPFFCLIRIDQLTPALALQLKQAGCYLCMFGLESGVAQIRRTVLNRHISDAKMARGVALLKQRGIKLLSFNMLNLPGETLAEGLRTLQRNVELGIDYPNCSIFQPFPATKLYQRLQSGEYPTVHIHNQNLSFFSYSVLQQPDSDKLVNLQKLFHLGVRYPRTIPWISKIVHWPPNVLFHLIFLLFWWYRVSRTYRMTWLETFRFNWGHLRSYLARPATETDFHTPLSNTGEPFNHEHFTSLSPGEYGHHNCRR